MKKITLASLTMCLILVIVLVISAATLADTASETNKKVEQHFEKANELLKSMEYEAAIAEYEKVINISSNSKIAQNAQYWIGQSHFRAGQFDAAQATFAKLIEQYPVSAIVPVTKLMVGRVEQAKKNEEKRRVMSDAADKGFIIDPKTGVKYTKTKTFVGKRDVLVNKNALNLSPNGKFLLQDNLVIPLNGEEPFNLVDMRALRGIWSPDGKKVAFYSERAIWVIPVSPETGQPTGPAKKLLDGRYIFQHCVRWSPDSETIAFVRRDEKTDGDIWTLSVKDGALTQITDDPLPERFPRWSRDGRTIVYEKYDNGIWLVPAEGGIARKVIDSGGRGSWSPDGKGLIYREGGKLHLFRLADERVFDFDIGRPPDGVGGFFSWSPDGKKMLSYSSSYDWGSPLNVVSVSGGPSFELGSQLPLSTLWAYTCGWSPDSKMIVAHGTTEDRNSVLWIIPLAGGDPFPLELDVSVPGKPDVGPLDFWGKVGPVSPDRKKLAFIVERSDENKDLWVVPVSLKDGRTTGPAVMVFAARDGKSPGRATWSPDSKRLAVLYKGDIWIASAEGGTPVQITKTPENENSPVWSPDGEMIAYKLRIGIWGGKEHQILHVISVSGGEATEILDTSIGRKRYAWSPDSKEIAVVSEGVISAIPIAGGKARQILDLKHQGFVTGNAWGLSWHPDGKYLAFISANISWGGLGYSHQLDRGDDAVYEGIFMVPAKGGKFTELVADDPGEKYTLYWSPDGKWLSYNSDRFVKTRPEGTMWEADFEEILKKALR